MTREYLEVKDNRLHEWNDRKNPIAIWKEGDKTTLKFEYYCYAILYKYYILEKIILNYLKNF